MRKLLKSAACLVLAAMTSLCLGAAAFAADPHDGDLAAGSIETQDASLEVGQTVEVDYKGEPVVYTFTAPESGMYRFYSTGNYDTYLSVYADADGQENLGGNDDGGESTNFSLELYIGKGKTVYLYPRLLEESDWGTFKFKVVEGQDLEVTSIEDWVSQLDSNAYLERDGYHSPVFSLYYSLGDTNITLQQDDAFTVSGLMQYDSESQEYVPIEGDPSGNEYYYVTLQAKEGAPITGERIEEVYVRDYRDLSEWYVSIDEDAYIDNGIYHAPVVSVYRGGDSNTVSLTAGEDYIVGDCEQWDDDADDYVPVVGGPTEPGGYSIQITAKEGSGYTGTLREWITVKDYSDLQYWQYEISESGYIDVDGFHAPQLYLYKTSAGEKTILNQEGNFVLKDYAYWDEGAETYRPVEGVPQEAGDYEVTLKPAQGSSYTGTKTISLWVSDRLDISNWGTGRIGNAYIKKGQYIAPTFYLDNYAGDPTYEGETFEIAGYEKYDESTDEYTAVEGDIQQSGDYRAIATAINGYKGVTYFNFTVEDYSDIGNWSGWARENAYLEDGTYHEAVFTLYRYDSESEESVYLEQNTDFRIAGYRYWDEEEQSYLAVEGVPATAGNYEAILEAIEGSGYSGTYEASFTVEDYAYLQYWTPSYDGSYIDFDGFHDLEISLYRYKGDDRVNLVQDVDFFVDGYQVWDYDTEAYVALTGNPTQAGEYLVTLKAADGASVTGVKTLEVEVADYRELQYWDRNWQVAYIDSDGYHEPDFYLYRDKDDNRIYLRLGEDFEVEGYERYDLDEERYVAIDGKPTTSGNYRATLRALDTASVSGTNQISVEVYDYSKLNNLGGRVSQDSYMENGVFHAPTFVLSYCTDNVNDEYVYLTQGVDFEIAGYAQYDYEQDEYIDLQGNPATDGDYYAKLVPVEGSKWTGVKYFSFVVNDYSNLKYWDYDYSGGGIDIDGFYEPIFELYRRGSNYETFWLEQGKDFEISAYEKITYDYDDNEQYLPIEGAPEEPGEYRVTLSATAGASVTGTLKVSVYICDYHTLNNWYASRSGDGYIEAGVLHAPTFHLYHPGKNGDVRLEEGTDFVVAAYEQEAWDSQRGDYYYIECTPDKAGEYYARLEPASGSAYTGSRHVWFKVNDYSDLACWDFTHSSQAYIANGEFHAPTLYAYRYNGEDDEVYLNQGEDFTIVGYRSYDEDLDEYVDMEGVPSQPGAYIVVLEATDSAKVKGTKEYRIYVRNRVSSDATLAVGSPATISIAQRGDEHVLPFTAAKAGDYTFTVGTEGNLYRTVSIYDHADKTGYIDEAYYDDEDREAYDCTVYLEKDQTVYLFCSLSMYSTGNMTVSVSFADTTEVTAEDRAAAQQAAAQIDALGAITSLDQKAAVVAARNAYEALTDVQKDLVSSDQLDKLEAAEAAIAQLQTAADGEAADKNTAAVVSGQIEALGAITSLDQKASVVAARAAYTALSDAQKAYVTAEQLKALEDAEAAIAELQKQEDTLLANGVAAIIAELPAAADVKASDAEAITNALTAYNALTDAQKALLNPDDVTKLNAASEALAAVTSPDAIDNAQAASVSEGIANLPETVDLSHADAIVAMRNAYNALTDTQKAKVTNLTRLEAAEQRIALLSSTFTITFKNDNGAVLSTVTAAYGTMPTYAGSTPTKDDDAQYAYTFAGWTPELAAATANAEYTATYSAVPHTFAITWKDEDGTVLATTTAEYGAVPAYEGPAPTKASDARYSYTFAGWSPELAAATANAEYTAQYTSATRAYAITWANEDGTVLASDNVEYGALPAYKGATPTKAADAQFTYEFSGWSPSVAKVTGAATYIATFKATSKVLPVGKTVKSGAATYKVTKSGAAPEVALSSVAASVKSGIPASITINGVSYKVTSIAKNAFKGNKKLTKAVVSKSVKSIGAGAFQNCKKLKKATIGASVKTIGKNAFKGCAKLKTITVKSGNLNKAAIKNMLKGSKITTIKLSGKAAKAKKALYKKYAGKKVVVK